MTVWRKLENEETYAVAIYNYSQAGSTAPHLRIEVGELVHCERETRHWYWATSLRSGATGAVPKSYLTVRPCRVDRCGDTILASAGGGGVVHDIAVTLREWLKIWKKLYKDNDDRFKFMEVSMRALLELRAQAASGALPLDQLRRVARTAVFTIDKGNRTLGMELAVRSAGGQLVDPLRTSTYKLNALHDEANARIEKNMETTPSSAPPTTHPSARNYSVCVRVHNFVCRMTDAAELQLSLYDSSQNKLTEHLLLRWPTQTMAPTQVVFTSVSSKSPISWRKLFDAWRQQEKQKRNRNSFYSQKDDDLGGDIKREKLFLVCHVVRIGSMDAQNNDHRRSSMVPPVTPTTSPSGMRRPFGVACVDITRHLAAEASDKHIQVPFYPCEKEKMETLLKHVITNQRELKDAKYSQGLWVSLQLVEGDSKQIREENPHIVVGNTAVARKMGFPDVILPGDARNDLYVTICSGSFSKGGGKSSERNIELSARVVNKKGDVLPGVISIGAGAPLVDEFTSIVYYHDDKPRWQETFKVCLTIEEFKEAHLVFMCRHRSSNEAKDRTEKPFALAYLLLMLREGTTTPDGYHDLCVYKIEGKRSGSCATAACLALPAHRRDLPSGAERGLTRAPLALVPKDHLSVHTKLCSTKLTQREEILGVLKWNTHYAEGNLRQALQRLLLVPSEEIVKFLQDILDALFSILTQVQEEQEGYTDRSYGVLVLECLLHVISLVADHKYQHFQPVLHVYIDDSFCDALAYEKLIAVMVWVITTADGGETKRLLQCMKCLECLMRIVARSRQLRSKLGDRAANTDFKYQFESLLEALVWLMRCESRWKETALYRVTGRQTAIAKLRVSHLERNQNHPHSLLEALVWLMRCDDLALTCQGAALKYLPHAVPHAVLVYPETELSAYVVRALDALPLGRLSKQRLHALLELCRGPLLRAAAARAQLVPHVAATIRALLRDKVELELCIETLGELVTLLSRDDVGPVEADRGELARRLLPTVLRTASAMLRDRKTDENNIGFTDDPVLRRLICVLLDMVRQMSEDQYSAVVKALEAESAGGAGSLVGDALALIVALLQRPVFRAHWADMLHLQHYVMLHALRLLGTTLRDRLRAIDDSSASALATLHHMCREWFGAVTALATSPTLQLEAMPAARRQRITTLYGDIRQTAAGALADMWFNLGDHRRAFIPCLVGPFLEVSFLRDDEVRNTTIPLFFDMMQIEFITSAVDGGEGSLRELESELIDKIDVLASLAGGEAGDAEWRAKFVSLCGSLCGAADKPLRQAAFALVAAAARQLDTLLQYRTAAQKSATPYRMHLTNRVLHFYEQIERPHMYIRYVHKLAKMHMEASQWAEAGLALRLHAILLNWSGEPLPQRLRHPSQPDSAHDTHRDLKEFLYLEIADLLNRGHQWELAVEIVKELVSVYEEELLGYGPLAELHSQLAQLYSCMLRTPRSHPGYYRVIYHGKGFPQHLRTSDGFVYRGNEYEQLADFKERLLDEWPDAEVLPKLDPPGEDITESDGQYLQINAVKPMMGDKLKRLSGKPVAEQILEYYKHNNVSRFVFDRPFHRPEENLDGSSDDVLKKNEFASRWLERTELEISDTLPGILRWFPVIEVKTYWVSPVEAAVEALQESNRALKTLILSTRSPETSLQPLTMRLQGILDPAVQGGVKNYESAFLTPSYEARHPAHAPLLQQLRDAIADQVPLLKFGLEVHGSRVPPALHGLHARLLSCFHDTQLHVTQRYGRKYCDFEPELAEVQFRMPLRDSSYTDPGVSTGAGSRASDASNGNDSVDRYTAAKSKFFNFNSAINPLARNSQSAIANFGFATMTSPKRRDKKRTRRSEVGTPASGSQWYTSHSTPNGSVGSPTVSLASLSLNNNNNTNNNANNSVSTPQETPSASPLRELRQELVPERPPRAEVERERRLSARTSMLPASAPHSNRDSMGTTDSREDDEEPPPLPQKSSRSLDADCENNNTEPMAPRYSYDTVFSPRGSFLYNSLAHRRYTTPAEKPPTPPPKKKNNYENNK